MDPMHELDETSPNTKVLLLAIGGAILAGTLVALARRSREPEPETRVEAVAEEVKKRTKKAAKAAKKKQSDAESAAMSAIERAAAELREATEALTRERVAAEMRAATWDAQQEA